MGARRQRANRTAVAVADTRAARCILKFVAQLYSFLFPGRCIRTFWTSKQDHLELRARAIPRMTP